MNPRQWERLKSLFEQAADQTAEQQALLLARLRMEDQELARELAPLLRAHTANTLPLDHPPFSGQGLPGEEPHLLFPGETLMGRFTIVRFIGRGGMGEVYEAQDRHMGRIAIKIIREDFVSSESIASRFRSEALAARSITTPLVCRIHEFLEAPAENGRPEFAFLTMEFLEGCTLWDRIEHDGPFFRPQAEHLAVQLCRGLQAIHDAGVIHRDLKGRNIMLVERQSMLCPVIMDFGLARQLVTADKSGLASESGTLMGTPGYMAPEQFEGGEVTRTADIYALGIVLYEMVVGKHPFEAATPLGAAVRRAKRPPSACSVHPEFPRRWDRVIERCLEYDSDQRYQSAAEVESALKQGTSRIVVLPRTLAEATSYRALVTVSLLLFTLCAASFVVLRSVNRGSIHPPEAVRLFEEGAKAFRDGTYLKATRLFQKAIGYDKNYALAHARLADAWSELDFRGNAQQEMLLASDPAIASGLSSRERSYLEAIRSTVTGDFTKAAHQYEDILQHLPPQEKAAGYLDAGRLHEKAGDIDDSIKDYSAAAHAAPDSPGAYLRLAVLKGREGDSADAEKAFTKAEELYNTTIDYEGLAEVDYQRGSSEATLGRLPEARKNEEKSLDAAQRIHSPQLQTRALTRLAVIAYGGGDEAQCIQLAKQAIELARDNNLSYWDIEARIRIGNAFADKLDFAHAETYLQSALEAAQEGQHPRLEALAYSGLADERNLQHRPDDSIAYAEKAQVFYTRQGFFYEALTLHLLVTRAQGQQAYFRQSLKSALEGLQIAKRSQNTSLLAQAEEGVGQAYVQLQDYPAALQSFQSALSIGLNADQEVDFQKVEFADVLWRLGRYEEAGQMLSSISASAAKQPDLAYELEVVRSQLSFSRLQYRQALLHAERAKAVAAKLSPSERFEIQSLLTEIHASLGSLRYTQELLSDAPMQAQVDPATSAARKLVTASVLLGRNDLAAAKLLAEEARTFFKEVGQQESEWQSLYLLAQIEAKDADKADAKTFAAQALDILVDLEHNWGSSIFRSYLSRPDLQQAESKLNLLLEGKHET